MSHRFLLYYKYCDTDRRNRNSTLLGVAYIVVGPLTLLLGMSSTITGLAQTRLRIISRRRSCYSIPDRNHDSRIYHSQSTQRISSVITTGHDTKDFTKMAPLGAQCMHHLKQILVLGSKQDKIIQIYGWRSFQQNHSQAHLG